MVLGTVLAIAACLAEASTSGETFLDLKDVDDPIPGLLLFSALVSPSALLMLTFFV